MVLGIIVALGLLVAAFTFRGEIQGLIGDFRREKTPEERDIQKVRDERGALENTQAFILGEEGLAGIKEREAGFNQFLEESQKNIGTTVATANTSLVAAQKQLEDLALQSQKVIAGTAGKIAADVNTGVQGTIRTTDTAIQETKTAFDQGFAGASTFFNNIFSGAFGGQQTPKPITKAVPAPNSPPPKITTDQGGIIDLSFLSAPSSGFGASNETEELTEKQAVEDRATRFSGTGSRR